MNPTLQNDDFFMDQALAEARKAFEIGEIPIGAVVVWEDRIVARAHNLVETLSDPTAHAEMQAITAATSAIGGKYLPQCRLYVSVEPCVMCAGACFWAQIGTIIYATKDPKRGATTLPVSLYHPKTQLIGGVREEEASELMSQFFAQLRRS